MELSNKKRIQPMFKWMGGKTRLSKYLSTLVPDEFDTYFEPFIGAGSLLLTIQPSKFYISDISKELINVWKTLTSRELTDTVIKNLVILNSVHNYTTYYDMRDNYNSLPILDSKHATILIYLMHYCFNGVYRTNPKGEFNTPFNKSYKPIKVEKLYKINEYLEDTMHKIKCQDFAKTLVDAKKGDFVYLDPPYDNEDYKKHHYDHVENMEDFQLRLFNEVEKLNERGVKFMMTNSATERILNLYSKYNIELIEFKNVMSKNRQKKQNQIIIKNY